VRGHRTVAPRPFVIPYWRTHRLPYRLERAKALRKPLATAAPRRAERAAAAAVTYAVEVADNGATPRAIEGAPWEADPAWHPARREAFVAYRAMPDRSIRAVARSLDKSATLVGR
jgi:hypothetical protein